MPTIKLPEALKSHTTVEEARDDAEKLGMNYRDYVSMALGVLEEMDGDTDREAILGAVKSAMADRTEVETQPTPNADDSDIFAQATRARKERKRTGARPKITRKAMAIPVVTKTKAWFRVHPDGVFSEVPIFIDPTSEEMEAKPYYVVPDLADELEGSDGLIYHTGYLICTASGKNMLFLVKEADMDGNMHSATEAKHEACVDAKSQWTRMTWDKDVGQYQISQAEWDRKEPRWPEDVSEETVFRRAFGKQVIDDWDYPVLKSFRGEG
ncbi:hypothetical protein R3X27_22580 [Tropicimonas sp. TH_r6]|uniref:hypothetical protein n=1 Tax=Tropicimonas sp. TH_r6 TaxID=3082085 RepID=UPI002953E7DE|nr:hypothetical protein [Tropicimonas sp. TH_r6]MDV7145481.1 hypothetical protein [Tropicimonas sp. TH_r6]